METMEQKIQATQKMPSPKNKEMKDKLDKKNKLVEDRKLIKK